MKTEKKTSEKSSNKSLKKSLKRAAKKSWKEKLNDSKDLPRVINLNAEAEKRWGGKTMVIPAPIEVDAVMKTVKKGKVITINDIRKQLSEKHSTETACPITTGIFAWIASHAAEEERKGGKKKITPYWRTIKSTGELNEKYPGGILAHKRALQAEGHEIVKKGKKYKVVK
ncbi:MAG: MGMT family protein [Bacteroidetes bacterium]|nr:MGMT family protein [Bacteroidota bacterium]